MRAASLLLAAACGCAGAEAMTTQQPGAAGIPTPQAFELGLNPGESMAFEVRLAGILAGEAQLAVGEIGEVDGHQAIVVPSRAATAGAAALIKKISDEATAVIDATTGRPISVDTLVVQGDKQIKATAKFNGPIAVVTY